MTVRNAVLRYLERKNVEYQERSVVVTAKQANRNENRAVPGQAYSKPVAV